MNPPCPICEETLGHVEGEFGPAGNQLIFWTCRCGFREPIRCAACHEVITTFLRNGPSPGVGPGVMCSCGFYSVLEVVS